MRGKHRRDYQHQYGAVRQTRQQQAPHHTDLRLGVLVGANGFGTILGIVVHDGLHGIKKIGGTKLEYHQHRWQMI
jgi:hypothetical protein